MDNYNEILNELIEGTNFEISMESQVLTSSVLKVRTPIEIINCMLGGGIPLNGIYHTWGPPKGGKSTWLYQTMANFQKQYPEGVCVILDMESSADANRLRSFGIDTTKVLRLPTTSIESGFLALFQIIEKKQNNKKTKDLPMMVIWDTISRGLAQDGSTQSRMNAQDRARIIKNYMPDLSARIEKQPFILGLINQVVYETDRYGNRHSTTGGGVALQHDNHMSIMIEGSSVEYDTTGTIAVAKWSKASIDKSKMCPEMKGIPFKIDITKGGSIVERQSFLHYMMDYMHCADISRGWYSLEPLYKKYEGTSIGEYLESLLGNKRYQDMVDLINSNDLFYDILRYDYLEYISNLFTLQANIIKDYKEEIHNKVMLALEPSETVDTVEESTTEEVVEEDTSDNTTEVIEESPVTENMEEGDE